MAEKTASPSETGKVGRSFDERAAGHRLRLLNLLVLLILCLAQSH
jgi:hypothetical protein